MKLGEILKGNYIVERNPEMDLIKINQFTRKELTSEDVYIFPVKLCGNEIDRDNEKFSISTLYDLQKLFIGKTGILDHTAKTSNQVARIFDTQVLRDDAVKTKDGETYHYLLSWAYIPNTDSNKQIISDIETGIKKEVSIGCSIEKSICSICGVNRNKEYCQHRLGQTYDNSFAYATLDTAKDAYEWSFVAVPAQPDAGVTKKYEKQKGDDTMFIEEELQQNIKSLIETGEQCIIYKNTNGLIEVSKNSDSEKPFISKKNIFEIYGKEVEQNTLIDDLKCFVEIGKTSKEIQVLLEKSNKFDKLKEIAIENALSMGVGATAAKNTKLKSSVDFDVERYRKILETFTIEEINAQSKDWETEKSVLLNAGVRVSVEPEYNTRNGKDPDFSKYEI